MRLTQESTSMRCVCRRLLISALLVMYTGISLVGHGLHWLSSADHHHHGLSAVCSPDRVHSHNDCVHHGHNSAHVVDADGQTRPSVAASAGVSECHDCDICAFLFQARSQSPQVAMIVSSQPVIAALAIPLHDFYSPTSLGPHAPRGPPLHLS
jgi:hypothetical protein